jgi:hypothetical protein
MIDVAKKSVKIKEVLPLYNLELLAITLLITLFKTCRV